MAGIALKGQCDFVSIMVPPEVSFIEKNAPGKQKIYLYYFKSCEKCCSFKIMDRPFFAAFRILIKYIGTNFLSTEVFKVSSESFKCYTIADQTFSILNLSFTKSSNLGIRLSKFLCSSVTITLAFSSKKGNVSF